MTTLKTWALAARPKTLPAAIAPVVVGTALAHGDGRLAWLPALAALAGALLIQIATNLSNDYYDFQKGADTHDRVGPMRVTQAGLIAPQTVLRAAVLTFLAAFVVGIYLVAVGGWPIVVLGLLSLLFGWMYTGGPWPLAYLGLGDVFVFLFFGFGAVGGTYWVQAQALSPAVGLGAAAMGALATAILTMNNLRDAETDARAGKRTLIVRLGVTAGRLEYFVMLAIAAAAPVLMWALGLAGPAVLLALLSAPLAITPVKRALRQSGKELFPGLGETARLQLAYALLFAAGLAWR